MNLFLPLSDVDDLDDKHTSAIYEFHTTNKYNLQRYNNKQDIKRENLVMRSSRTNAYHVSQMPTKKNPPPPYALWIGIIQTHREQRLQNSTISKEE